MNKQILIEALNNPDFIRFFRTTNGGFNPIDYPLLAQDEIYHLWVCTDAEFLASQEKHCTEGERAKQLLESRNLAREKMWRYFIAYTNTKMPGSVAAKEFSEKIKPWSVGPEILVKAFCRGFDVIDSAHLN